jgi:hypothetical protein
MVKMILKLKFFYSKRKKVYQSSYSLTDEEFINLNGIDYLAIHNPRLKSLSLIDHKCHQYFDSSHSRDLDVTGWKPPEFRIRGGVNL